MSEEENKIPSRVSITYSVDLQEVPDRVKILLNELANSFGGIAKLCRDSANKVVEDPLEGTRGMADLSSLIKKTNLRVEDCMDIMIGYIQILQKIPVPDKEEAPSVEPAKTPKKKTPKKKTTKKKSSKKKDD
tara:strand:- start:41 stop:436 length:396 start_codon:yes stop_codon:yes gene_type:complete